MATVTRVTAPPRSGTVLAGFTAYGALWGPYLSLLPQVQSATGASKSELGIALLAGALATMPAMYAVGKLLDRFGRPVAVGTVVAFALIAATPMLARSVPELIAAVALFGFGSGACNVIMVALAAAAEAGGSRLMNRAHALFSGGLLALSLATGIAASAGAPGPVIALVLALAVAVAAVVSRRRIPARLDRPVRARARPRLGRTILLLSLLAALGMVVESGVQQWSAVFLTDVTRAPVGLSAAAPGIFAGAMAVGRFGGHWLHGRSSDRLVLLASGVLSGIGVLALAVTGHPVSGLLGIAVVGGAVSVCTPTVYGLVGRRATAQDRGAVIGSTASLASVGLLIGPALVGQVAGLFDLRTAIAGLAVVSVAVCLLALRVPTHGFGR